MGYKAFVRLNIAVIGADSNTLFLAQRLFAAGHSVSIGWKDGAAGSEMETSNYWQSKIKFTNIEQAADEADVIMITSSSHDVREVAYLLDDVRQKVILDCTFVLPNALDENINTANAITAITGSAHVAKCFKSGSYKKMIAPLFQGALIDLFVAGNSKKAKEIARILSRDLGLNNCHDFGDTKSIVLLEEMSKCWYSLALKEKEGSKVQKLVVKR